MKSISIVIPVYNSENCIEELHKRIADTLKNNDDFEIIFVNDKSTDESWKIITAICKNSKNTIAISLKKNAGQDNAILAGLTVADGEFIIIMDDDLQHPPEQIFKLVEQCEKGHDVCYAHFPQKHQSFWKNAGSRINGLLAEKMIAKPKELYLSPFKALKKAIAMQIVSYSGPFPYIDGIILNLTENITQVEMEHRARYSGKSNYTLARSVSVFIRHMMGYSVYPLHLLTLAGLYSAVISSLLGAYYMFDYFCNEEKVEGWITIVILILFFGGLMLIGIGLIGEYVGKIYLTLNKKPQYSIEKIIGNKFE